MKAVLQRVREARVEIDGDVVGRIGTGLLVLLCAEREDTDAIGDRLLAKILKLRIFSDEAGRMNRSLLDVQGDLLVVSQFTLAADTGSGLRPSFTPAAPAALGERLYGRFVQEARRALDGLPAAAGRTRVAAGRFGADMRVALVNDGPVTFWLRVAPQPPA